MPPCLCGHQYREHRDGGACTRCSRCFIFEPDEPPTAKRPLEIPERVSAPFLAPSDPLPEIPEPAGESRSQPEQSALPFEPEPPDFPMEMPIDDRDTAALDEAPRSPERDPWWLDA